jgi:hypothetical protein
MLATAVLGCAQWIPGGIMSASADRATGLPFLQGQWRRLSLAECAQRYPVEITFVLATYRGARSPDQGMIQWDAGIYRLADDQTLIVSTATDELVEYPVRLTSHHFTFTDSEGCEVTYERMTAVPPSPSGSTPEGGE